MFGLMVDIGLVFISTNPIPGNNIGVKVTDLEFS